MGTHKRFLNPLSFLKTLTETCQHENAVIAYLQLVSILEVFSGHKVIILQENIKRQRRPSTLNV